MNPAVAAQLAQKMSAQELAGAARGMHPQIPPYVAASEMMRRRDLQARAQGMQAMAQNAQDKTVLEDLLDGSPINPDGIGSLPAMTAQQPQEQQQPQQLGMPQPPAQTSPPSPTPPNGKGYASGGLVAFDDGGAVSKSGASAYGTGPRLPVYDPDYQTPLQRFLNRFRTPEPPLANEFVGVNYVEPQPDLDNYQMPFTSALTTAQDTPDAPVPPPGSSSNRAQGIRVHYEPKPVSVTLPPFLQGDREVPGIASLMEERKALMPQGEALSGLAAAAEQLRDQVAQRRSQNVGEALLSAGAAMAASRSPYFMQAVGEGAQHGLASFQAGRKEVDQLERLRVQYEATVEQARRAEAIGNVDAAQKLHQHAEDLQEKYRALQTTFSVHEAASQRSLQGQLAVASAHSERTQADRELMHEDRIARLETDVYRNAYTESKNRLKDDPKAMMMTEEQKEQIAIENANRALANYRAQQQKGGVPAPYTPPAGKIRGRLDSSGNLVQ